MSDFIQQRRRKVCLTWPPHNDTASGPFAFASVWISPDISVWKICTFRKRSYSFISCRRLKIFGHEGHRRTYFIPVWWWACPVCVIVAMIVKLHSGKSMMTNMVVSKTMQHSPANTVLGHSADPILPDVFPAIKQYPPHTAAGTPVITLCHTHLLPGTVRNRVFPGSYCTSFLSYYSM